jgi:uncharacterized cupin superfamily protein
MSSYGIVPPGNDGGGGGGVAEARIEDGVPQTAGWFVLNAREAQWMHDELRAVCRWGGQGPAHFDDLGLGLYWIEPGRAMSLYHHEAGQEDFLLLRGTALAIVEGEERPLEPWDLVHCPPRTAHTIVATGDEPCLIFAVGARKERSSARYPVDEAAVRHAAGVERAVESPAEAYAGFAPPRPGPPPDIFG